MTNWISGGGNRNCKAKRRYKTIGFYIDWDYNIVVYKKNVYKDIKYYHFIYIIYKDVEDGIQNTKGVMFRG
jgi:hypothetical protein